MNGKRLRGTLRTTGMRNTILTIALALAAASAFANPFGQMTILVPINPGAVPGAGGTQWTTSLWVTNTADRDAVIVCDNQPCPTLKAHSTTRITAPPLATPHQGFYLGIPSGIIVNPIPNNSIFAELRTTDSATAPHSAGTEVPVVPLSQMRATTIAMPHVPVNGHSRSRLRVYGALNGTASVRVIGVQSNQELYTATLQLTGVDNANLPGNALPRWPSYAEIALPDVYPGSDDAVRIEITPSADTSIWAFVSVTDNESQQFTIITPAAAEYIPISLL